MGSFWAFIIGIFVGLIIASIPGPICPKCKHRAGWGNKRTLHQMLWGGWTCKNCGAELDRKGNVIKKKGAK